MPTYFPFGHIIVATDAVVTSHPYLSVWNVCEPVTTPSDEQPAISEIYY